MDILKEQEILKQFAESKREGMDISDCMDVSCAINREIYIPIELDNLGSQVTVGSQVALTIRYWNRVDEEENLPPELRKPIKVFIDCMGGNLTDAFSVVDAIKNSKTPVWTIVTGQALSGGFLIAISGHKRFAYPHASFLLHEGAGGFGGDANKFANFALFYKKQIEQMKQIVLSYTKITEDKYKEIKNDDFWMTAEEALELGCVDVIEVV